MAKPLELYIHIPFCMKKCAYCDFLSFPAEEALQWRYTAALLKEIRHFGEKMKEYEVTTIFIGGGTPTWLDLEWMMRLLDVIGENFFIRRDAEVTIECNPGTVTKDKLTAYRQSGINRLSIGLQSTDNGELKLLGRVHTYEQFLKTYEMARTVGFRNINVDLMSGIPYQDLEKFAKSLLRVIRLKPEHISVYSLMIEKGTPFYSKYKYDLVMQEAGMQTKALPSEDEVYRILKATQQILKNHGYEQYEVSNFARPGKECKHNLGYWERKEYLGMGLGASSLINNVRFSNLTDVHSYINEAENIKEKKFAESEGDKEQITVGINLHETAHTLSRKEQMEEYMYLGLRKIEGISRQDFQEAFRTPINAVYTEAMEKLRNEGLMELKAGMVRLTDRGQDLSNYALAHFLFDE